MMREDWIKVQLGDVCDRVDKVKRNKMPLDESFIYLDIGGINNNTNRIVGHKTYTWADAPSRAQQVIRVGDVLFSTVRTYLKNIAQVTKTEYDHQVCSSGFTVIRGQKGVLHHRYVYYFTLFVGFLQPLNELQTGTSYPAVRDNDVFAQKIPLAPLPEQRAIVAKIEQLFSELDNGIDNLLKAKDKLEIYRQSVLKKAFEGELTRDWRKNEEEAPSDIPFVYLKELADVATGATPKKTNSSYWEGGEVPWVTSGALNNFLVEEASEFITGKALKETNCKVFPKGSLLIAMYGEGKTRGKCSELAIDAATNQAIAAVLIKDGFHESKRYLKWFFIKNYNDIRMLSSGGVQPNLNLSKVKETKIPFPSIQEQYQIVHEIESRLSVCDNILANIDEGLEKAESLRQSILKQAFEGRLLNEDELEACRRESDWESAEKLLERIKKEKE